MKSKSNDWTDSMRDYAKREHIKHEASRGSRKVGYAFAVIVNAVLIWVFNNLLSWHIPFLENSFTAVLWLFNLSFLASIICNLLLLIHDPKWFHGFVRLISNSISFIVLLSLYFIYPFDFSVYQGADWNTLAKILIILSTVGTGIGIIVEFLMLIFSPGYRKARE